MTPAMQNALNRFIELGESGIIDRYGRMLVAGEPIKSVDPATWLRLVLVGKIYAEKGRFFISKV